MLFVRTIMCFAILICAQPALAQNIQASVLSKLVGEWTVTGSVRDRPTKTNATGKFIVGGAFLELSFADKAGKSPYQAKVFFGEDPSGLLTVHWIDGTGGGTSRTLGTGRAKGNIVTLSFPYPEREFRDHLEYDPSKDSWRLLIVEGAPEKETIFSDWIFTREAGPRK